MCAGYALTEEKTCAKWCEGVDSSRHCAPVPFLHSANSAVARQDVDMQKDQASGGLWPVDVPQILALPTVEWPCLPTRPPVRSPDNCASCTYPETCDVCNGGFVSVGGDGVCTLCSELMPGCASCSSPNQCDQCAAGALPKHAASSCLPHLLSQKDALLPCSTHLHAEGTVPRKWSAVERPRRPRLDAGTYPSQGGCTAYISEWTTVSGGPWTATFSNTVVSLALEADDVCGGTGPSTRSDEATATLTVRPGAVLQGGEPSQCSLQLVSRRTGKLPCRPPAMCAWGQSTAPDVWCTSCHTHDPAGSVWAHECQLLLHEPRPEVWRQV